MSKTNNTTRRAFNVEWLGQMMASVLWALSVFVYGINSTGDVLQLCAALAWMIANVAALMNALSKNEESFVHAQKTRESNGT